MRIVIHAPTAGALKRARSNLKNLLAARPDAEVRIIANADAVKAATESPDPSCDAHVCLCENTLARMDMKAPEGVATVPAGVEEIARLQSEGWIYIRA